MSEQFRGAGFCGDVEVTVSGAPVAMGYCHCSSCREWSAGPVNAFTLWNPADVKITKGESQLGAFQKTERSVRKFCTKCGGHVLTEHPTWGLVDVYAAILPSLPFRPKLHVSYGEKVLSVRDGLPKFENAPVEMGGSGVMLPE